MNENVGLFNVTGPPNVDANGQLESTASPPPMAVPPLLDAISQSSDSSHADEPIQPQPRDAPAPVSFSHSTTDAGSIGAILGYYARSGEHMNPLYVEIRRLGASARQQKQLKERMDEAKAESTMFNLPF